MNKKLIFRILGALASALIIVSVFVPFVSVTGFTQSLWEGYKSLDTLYLPIMIIVFGAIGVIFFSLNIKTEFAYMSTGAILFFVIMQTIDVIDQGTFSTLSIGYYFLVIGAVLTGVMAFLANLKTKQKLPTEVPTINNNQPSMLEQIDKLYDDQPKPVEQPIQNLNAAINPVPVEPIQPQVQPQPIQPQVEVVQPVVDPVPVVNSDVKIDPIKVDSPIPELSQTNPVVQEFTNPTPVVNPTVQEFSNNQPVQNMSVQNNVQPQPVQQPRPDFNVPLSSINDETKPNPVVQEFTNPTQSNATVNQANNSGVDIFGQPINK